MGQLSAIPNLDDLRQAREPFASVALQTRDTAAVQHVGRVVSVGAVVCDLLAHAAYAAENHVVFVRQHGVSSFRLKRYSMRDTRSGW